MNDQQTESTDPPLLREMRFRNDPGPPNGLSTPGTSGGGDSFNFHTSFQDLGKKLKACNDVLGELQSLGVSHDVPLPELVLVGDQSAGKSSVMSGLANLALPRSEGTCTRCPLHIRVSAHSDWSCRVSLTKDYIYEPPHSSAEITEEQVTDEDPFFPWKELPTTKKLDFKTVHDPSELEQVLRWAQIAILEDDKSHQLFIPGSGSMTNVDIRSIEPTAKFSPNIVSLEIKGPDLPNLSFYDMPGIFQSTSDDRDGYLVNVVENLAKSYILRPSAIVMCSIPMNNDAQNSCTFRLIRRLRAADRTIGVLTKADLLPPDHTGRYTQWMEIMEGKGHQTGFGYFITSRPQDNDLDELQKWEDTMFQEGVGSWPAEKFSRYLNRCGVERLKAFLSERLGEQFMDSLPQIEHKVNRLLHDITKRLDTLPELPDNIPLKIHRCLRQFDERARLSVSEFAKNLGEDNLPEKFRNCLLGMKPKFILIDKTDSPPPPVEVISDDSDNSHTTSITTAVNTPSKRRHITVPTTPAKRAKTEMPGSGRLVKPESSFRMPSPSPSVSAPTNNTEPFTHFYKINRGFRTLAQVRQEMREKAVAGMPQRIADKVYEELALEAIRPWKDPMNLFLEQVMHLLDERLKGDLSDAFVDLRKRLVFNESKKHVKAFLRGHLETTKTYCDQVYKNETARLFTLNEAAFEQEQEGEMILLTRFRHMKRMVKGGYMEDRPLVPWETMTEAKRREETKKREDELLKIGPDRFAAEVEVIAYVRGYYRLAASRFADNVAQRVFCGMLPDILAGLESYLDQALDTISGGPAVFERLMAEDEATAKKRDTLKAEKQKFLRALESIQSLKLGNPAADEEMDDAGEC